MDILSIWRTTVNVTGTSLHFFPKTQSKEVRDFWDDYWGILHGPWNAVLKLLSHTNKRMSVDLKKKKNKTCWLSFSVCNSYKI